MAKENLSDAILNQDNPKYSEDVTKGLLADFMTNRQSQMFYGGDETYKTLVPGVDEAISDIEEAKTIAKEVKYPILIKASAGGGGKGMRLVNAESEFEEQMQMAQNEARSSFGNDAVFSLTVLRTR